MQLLRNPFVVELLIREFNQFLQSVVELVLELSVERIIVHPKSLISGTVSVRSGDSARDWAVPQIHDTRLRVQQFKWGHFRQPVCLILARYALTEPLSSTNNLHQKSENIEGI